MLRELTWKLCPILYFAIVAAGCGKKIIDPKPLPAHSIQNQETPSRYVISLNSKDNTVHQNYLLGFDAQFKIPEGLIIRKGTGTNKVVQIAHDVNEFDPHEYLFKCIYIQSLDPTKMVLEKCVDSNDYNLGDVSANTFTLYKNSVIQVRLISGYQKDLNIEAIYNMKWVHSIK